MRVVFIGWNPPKPYRGFWFLDEHDNLRGELHTVLLRLRRVTAHAPDGWFLEEFLEAGYYFVHAVKCWAKAKYPGFGRGAVPRDRRNIGEPLARACAAAHLCEELRRLAPKRVCALGELAYCALRALQPDLDPKARPTEGRRFELSVDGINVPLLYTSFPSSSPVRGRQLRDFTRGHLEEFLA
ncbi:MAG: hypothetical protein HY294_06295 [Candidatus Rokubacteria bacterium]|nr:hypothetical protein [Candidatus Rokubacteria bacterium]